MSGTRTRRAGRFFGLIGVTAIGAGLVLPTLAEPAEAAANFTADYFPKSGGPGTKVTFTISGCSTPVLSEGPAIRLEIDTDTLAPTAQPVSNQGARDRREVAQANPAGMSLIYNVPEEFDYVAGANRGPVYPVSVFCANTRAGTPETANLGDFTYTNRSLRPVAPIVTTTTLAGATPTTAAPTTTTTRPSLAAPAAPAAPTTTTTAVGATRQATTTTAAPTTTTAAAEAAGSGATTTTVRATTTTTTARSGAIPVTGGFDRELASLALLLLGVGCIVTGRGLVRSAASG